VASMASSPRVLLAPRALARLAFHALRFPAMPVAGVLVGEILGGKAEAGDAGSSGSTESAILVHDVLAVAHSQLLPALWEVALASAEQYAERIFAGRDVRDCGVVGAYFANAGLTDNLRLPKVCAGVADSLVESAGRAVGILLVDNERLSELESTVCVSALEAAHSGWQVRDKSAAVVRLGSADGALSEADQGRALQRIVELLGKKLEHVRDFEEHMDAPEKVSWLPDPEDRSFE
jgi:Uncharacterised protein family (UPF0172)